MDKKNTLLLTVIAVATLLVAVVGATFAYFSVSNSTNTASTTVTANAGKIGTVTVKKGDGTFQLLVTAQDMAKQSNNVNYYAINGTAGNQGETTGGKYAKTKQSLKVGNITLSNADANDTVSCTVTVKVDLTGDMVSQLSEGDVFLSLSGVGLEGGHQDMDVKAKSSNFSFETNTATASYTGTVSLKAGSLSSDLIADLYLVNKSNTDQKALAGKSLTANITLSTSDCTTTSAAAS